LDVVHDRLSTPGGLVRRRRARRLGLRDVIRPLPADVAELLDEGAFCYLGVRTPGGMHATPVVYAVWDHALWVTTARRSVKARTWRTDRRVAGLVRTEAGSVVFAGTVRPHDRLDPSTWMSSARHAHRL